MIIIKPALNFIDIWTTVWPYLVAIALFLVIVFIHEFGHFIVAKILGVRVNEFSIGFGPRLFSFKGKETEYSIRAIPFGGFCAMEGEDEASEDKRAFCNKKAWKRFLIVAAGAVFNIILGFVIFMGLFAPAGGIATNTVASFTDDATSAKTGLMVGDEIRSVDGRGCLTVNEIAYAFSAVTDNKVDMVVIRNGEKVTLRNVEFVIEEYDGIKYFIRDFNFVYAKNDFPTFISMSVKYTISYAKVVFLSLVDLIGGRFQLNAVSGPVGIASVLGDAAKVGLDSLLPLLALITINLGVFNLFPLPALDGGRLVFILYEMIFSKPVPQKKEALVHGIGFAVIIGFLVIITLKDIFGFFV